MSEKILQKEIKVSAPIKQVWECWTTEAGVATFFAPEANIELQIGGQYEMYFLPQAPPGSRGSEGCKIRELDPLKRLVFS